MMRRHAHVLTRGDSSRTVYGSRSQSYAAQQRDNPSNRQEQVRIGQRFVMRGSARDVRSLDVKASESTTTRDSA